MKKKLTKGGILATAVLWTITTLMWTVTTILRFTTWSDTGLRILSVLTVLLSLLACIIFWVRYAQYEKDN